MRCQRSREAIVAYARSAGEPLAIERALAHVETCAACRLKLEEQQALTAGLRALADTTRSESPSDTLEQRLLAAFEGQRAATGAPAFHGAGLAVPLRWQRLWPVAAGLAVAVGAVVWFTVPRSPTTPEPMSEATPTGIIELVGFQRIPQAVALPDFDSGAIVRTEIAVNALPVYGVRIPADVASAAVKVDFLVGQDGHPRAIRLVTEEFQGTRSRR